MAGKDDPAAVGPFTAKDSSGSATFEFSGRSVSFSPNGADVDMEVDGVTVATLDASGGLNLAQAPTSGRMLVADGTNWNSTAMINHATLSANGSLNLQRPHRVYVETTALTATNIVGTSAGDLGHADGVELVAATGGQIICPVAAVINYTFDTAAYTGGGDITAGYEGGAAATGVIAAASSLGAGASNVTIVKALSGVALVNTALVLRAASGFTQPGTAAGTATVSTYYHELTAF